MSIFKNSFTNQDPNVLGDINKILEESASYKERLDRAQNPTESPFHETLANHGFTYKQSASAFGNGNNPKNNTTEHKYVHPEHNQSHVITTHPHDSGDSHFSSHKAQENGENHQVTTGSTKAKLDKVLTKDYGKPKGIHENRFADVHQLAREKREKDKAKKKKQYNSNGYDTGYNVRLRAAEKRKEKQPVREAALDEISKGLAGRYIKKASKSAVDNVSLYTKTLMKNPKRKIDNRTKGIEKATDRLVKEAAADQATTGPSPRQSKLLAMAKDRATKKKIAPKTPKNLLATI